jgi:FkbM family methyltransferase
MSSYNNSNHNNEVKNIIVDKDISILKEIGSKHRYDKWCVDFRKMKIFCTDLLSLYTALKDIFFHEIYALPSDIDSPRVIDGGGHIGIFCLYAKMKCPNAKITVFEPDERNLELLMKNLLGNGIRDVEVVPAGLFSREGETSFSSQSNDGSNIYSSEADSVIKTVCLSRYLTHDVDYLKLNIEGAEWDVLKESSHLLHNIHAITMEYHGFPELGQSLHGILALLDSAGFRYMIHDFDAHTNPATKPPFRLASQTRYYLLVHARRFDSAPSRLPGLGDICRTKPISRKFGLDLGTSICRYYIDVFLSSMSDRIQGRVLEVAENTYTKKFGTDVSIIDILHVEKTSNATIVGNLATGANIPENAFDCIILTQTLQCIKDYNGVLENCHKALRPNGYLLVTCTGLGQISRYDMDRWGEFWRFTDNCLRELLQDNFPDGTVVVKTYGNVASAKAYLDGLPAEELPAWVLDCLDNDYQVLVAGAAQKKINPKKAHPADAKQEILGSGQQPKILMYHRVATDELDAQLLCVSPENFEDHLRILKQQYRPVPLHQLIEEARQGLFIPRTVSITFDDGYLDNFCNALPLFEKHAVHATVFITTGRIKAQGGLWGDLVENVFLSARSLPEEFFSACLEQSWRTEFSEERLKAHDDIRTLLRQASPELIMQLIDELYSWANIDLNDNLLRPLLSDFDILNLSKSPYIEIGAHAVSHAKLTKMSAEMQHAEIINSKNHIEKIIKRKVTLFAYPYGTPDSFNKTTVKYLKDAGFTAAVAVTQTDLYPPVDYYGLPRWVVRNWDKDGFCHWMGGKNQELLENAMLEGRAKHLLKAQQRNQLNQSNKKKHLRLVYINTHDIAGGAAKSTWRLAEAQRQRGHHADLLVGFKKSNHPSVHRFDPEPDQALTQRCHEKGLLFYEFQGSHKLVDHPLVKNADVIHLQNLHGGYFNPFSIASLSSIKPVVWTLRDMQSITGHCAHAFDCNRWQTGCGCCPDLSIEPAIKVDTTSKLWNDKKEIYSKSRLSIVCPSQWMKSIVEKSILANQRIELIYNSVDTDIFQPYEKKAARREFGFPEDAIIIGSVAHGGSLNNQWKGGGYTLQALNALWKKYPDLLFVNIGGNSDNKLSNNIIDVPHVDDETRLAKIYSALDMFIYTPLADTCPLVVIESLSCGLPIVSFATGGVPDLVRQGEDGFLTPRKDVRVLVKATETLIKMPNLRKQFSNKAREGALHRFRLDDMAAKYEQLYYLAIKSSA